MENDLALISDRLRAETLIVAGAIDETAVSDTMARQADDGSWSDVEYDDTSPTHWKPAGHLQRFLDLACASRRSGGRFEGSPEVRDAFLAGLRFWTERDPVSDNWWYNCIGAPRTLGSAMLLMAADLPSELIEAARPQIGRSGFTRTGANLVWEASNLLNWACITGDGALLSEVVEKIGAEICITTDEGIQHDDSFYQHGPQNYALGYGRSFALDVTRIAVALAGTHFAFSGEKMRILSRLILDGQQWFVHGRQIDYHAMGREAFRGGAGSHSWNAGSLARICENMRGADPSRAPEFDAYASRVTGDAAAGASGPLGNKHFWRSDTMVHRAGGWYASVRFHSTRTYALEVRVDRENLQGYHLSDGVIFLMQRGDEYQELQPVWDYRKLPGLTFAETDGPLPYGRETPGSGNASFVGGVSDGLSGAAVMDFRKEGVCAKKAYFFTDGGVVCLGVGIMSEQPERVLTTLNQCRLKSEVAVMRGGTVSTLEKGGLDAEDVEAVIHDGVAYVFLKASPVSLRACEQSGSWRLVEDRASDETLSEDVFTCFIDHGTTPADGRYAYRIVPGASVGDLPKLAKDDSLAVLSNTSEIQAVSGPVDGLVQAVFYVPGVLTLSEGDRLAVDAACVVQLRDGDGSHTLTVADPTQELNQVTVTLPGRWTGRGASYIPTEKATHVVVLLPEGPYAGQSAIVPLGRA